MAATEHARSVINEKRTVADQVSTRTDKVYIRHVAGCAAVPQVSVVVQDGMLPGTEANRVEMPDPAMLAETEAIRDACGGVKTSVVKNGVLYTSRKLPVHTGLSMLQVHPSAMLFP
ncbi:MAG TPA: hypothetical protein VFM90_01430 [Cyclobacteriaceae bacterium]|nr:hypothetical protein [Cyclobacteriaceae bacterium]